MERELSSVDAGWWVVSSEQKLWLPQGELPHGSAENLGLVGQAGRIIGEWQGDPVWLVRADRGEQMGSVRQIIDSEPGLFQLAGRGVQLAEFYRSHRWCGYCGHEMHHSKTEWACLCGQCRQRYYPQIAPCIIVAIRRDDRILLAQHQRHRNGVHTVLAGFVEVGETLEQTVAREVMEESGIKVKNVRYVASQPWPFPHSLMMAFMADYDSGDIHVDPKELLSADWYHYDDLPLLPPVGTIARRLIEDTVALCRTVSE
ncbi:NAD(+) diphosphatase [Enterobacterales bacterium CwR94]|nr:NAD(+) diphosphatase [Enterobacterales bacterium CwR94]